MSISLFQNVSVTIFTHPFTLHPARPKIILQITLLHYNALTYTHGGIERTLSKKINHYTTIIAIEHRMKSVDQRTARDAA